MKSFVLSFLFSCCCCYHTPIDCLQVLCCLRHISLRFLPFCSLSHASFIHEPSHQLTRPIVRQRKTILTMPFLTHRYTNLFCRVLELVSALTVLVYTCFVRHVYSDHGSLNGYAIQSIWASKSTTTILPYYTVTLNLPYLLEVSTVH